MVFLTHVRNAWGYTHGPHNMQKRMQLFRFTWHYYGRHRRCYKIAIQRLHRAWLRSNRCRKLKSLVYKEVWQTRIEAACKEHGLGYFEFSESLTRSLCTVAKQHIVNTGLYGLTIDEPKGVFNRSLFVDEVKQ